MYKAFFGVELGDKEGAPREPAFRVLINLQPPGPDSKRSNTKRAPPTAVADAANKCKNDAMIYMARDDVIAAMAEQIGEAAVGYMHEDLGTVVHCLQVGLAEREFAPRLGRCLGQPCLAP